MTKINAIAAAHIARQIEDANLEQAAPVVKMTARWLNEAGTPIIEADDGLPIFVSPNFHRGDHGFREGDIRSRHRFQDHKESRRRAKRRGDRNMVDYCHESLQQALLRQIGCYKLDKHGINRGRRLTRGALKIAHLDEAASAPIWHGLNEHNFSDFSYTAI